MKILLVLLGILKISGIILLVLLAVIFLLLLFILLCPLAYELRGRNGEEYGCEAPEACFGVRWLLGILRLELAYGRDGLETDIRLFGRRLGQESGKKRDAGEAELFAAERGAEDSADSGRHSETAQEKAAAAGAERDKEAVQAEPEPAAEVLKKEELKEEKQKEKKLKKEKPETKPDKPFPTARAGAAGRSAPLQGQYYRGRRGIEPQESWEGSKPAPPEPERLNLNYFKNMPDKRGFIKLCSGFVKKLLKAVKPKRLELEGVIGAGDPAYTGLALAAAGMLGGIYGVGINVRGDFENAVAEGRISARGGFTPARLAAIAVGFALKKPVRKIIILYLKGK